MAEPLLGGAAFSEFKILLFVPWHRKRQFTQGEHIGEYWRKRSSSSPMLQNPIL
jgi:hypothetical protein